MNDRQFMGRLGWLSAVLAAQRDTVAKILLRLKGLGPNPGINLAIHKKFLRLLEQIADDSQKERDILHEIEQVEKRHHELKKRRLLKQADPEGDAEAQKLSLEGEQTVEKGPKRMGILTLFGLIYLFSSKPIKHKNQDLTVD